MSRILIDNGSSCDIMYAELFEKLGMKKEKLWPYARSHLQPLNGKIIHRMGYIKLLVTFGEERDTKIVNL